MKHITDKAQIAHLNALYTDIYSEEQAVEAFEYLANPSRGAHTSIAFIRKAYQRRELGYLLKRLDSVAFYSSKSDR